MVIAWCVFTIIWVFAMGPHRSRRLAFSFVVSVIAAWPAYARSADLGQRQQVSADVVACPNLGTEDALYNEISVATANKKEKDVKVQSIAVAEKLGCTVFGAGMTGVVIGTSLSATPWLDFVEMAMDPDERHLWMPLVAIGPVDPSKSIYAPFPSSP